MSLTQEQMLRTYRQKKALWSRIFSRTWSFVANTTLLVALVFCFVYWLNSISERSGSIVKIVEEPKSALFTGKKLNGLPVMRVELGKKIEYDLNWYYLEGGCTTQVRLDFEQVSNVEKGDPRSTVSLEMRGRNLPIGAPGHDHISRPQPVGLAPGMWLYSSTLTGVCANGRKPPPEKLVEFYLDVIDPRVPAFSATSEVVFTTPSIRAGDPLKWRYTLTRHLEGSATIIYTLVARGVGQSKPDDADLYILQRPAVLKTGTYPGMDVSFDTPESIHPGDWNLHVSTVTNLPSGRIQTDTLFEVNFEVLP